MTTLDLLHWASRAISLFNTIALLWLGLTVLLNVERRRPGALIAGGGLVLGGLFFAIHSAVVGRSIDTFVSEVDLWSRVIWLPFVVPPYLWYLVMAWYTGKLQSGRARHGLTLTTLWAIVASGYLIFARPLPPLAELVRPLGSPALAPGSMLAIIVLYPVFSFVCFVLALATLRRPEHSDRFMGDLGRQRAIPWLVAASVVLLAISLTVGAVTTWILTGLRAQRIEILSSSTVTFLLGFDALVAALVAVTVMLMGQAIVAYEIFTGKTLPRRGLFRRWRTSLLFASGYSAIVSASLSGNVDPTYQLILVTMLIAVVLAMVNWRSYVERDRSMEQLRPFVTSPRLVERLLHEPLTGPPGSDESTRTNDRSGAGREGTATASADDDPALPFRALCDDVLGARLAYLVPLGPLAPLVGSSLAHPAKIGQPIPSVSGLAHAFHSPRELCRPVDPKQYGGAVWAVPLWSERGLGGILLLGEKNDGGLYTQEEIEIARASGARLIDVRASAAMARRLMLLQRQRLAESQVLDRRTRQVLHDDVLPRLHTALLTLSAGSAESSPDVQAAATLLADVHHQIANLLRSLPASVAPNVGQLGLVDALRHEVEGEWSRSFDRISFDVDPEARRVALAIPPLHAEVLFGAAREAIRNAARHGRGGAKNRHLRLMIAIVAHDGLRIVIEDDGVGLGSSPRGSAGTGQGLALHTTLLAVVGGTLDLDSVPGAYTRVTLSLPIAPA